MVSFLSAVGIDSIKLELGSKPTVFEGLLGIAVTCKDEKTFTELYQKSMIKVLKKYNLVTNRIILKAYDIARIATGNEVEIIAYFLKLMINEIQNIDIFYTRYNPRRLTSITIFGEDRPETKKPTEFIRLIANAYPHYCGFYYLNNNDPTNLQKMYLDHFESYETPAWNTLSNFKGLQIVYKGGNCNCLVSIADLLLRLTIMEIKVRKEDFNTEGIKRIHSDFSGKSKTNIHFLGGKTVVLRFMAPQNRRKIELSNFIARPIVFVPSEKLTLVPSKEERTLFEGLPVYDDLANFLFHITGSFKYFKSDNDTRLVKKGDYFLVLGKNSEELYTYLHSGGLSLIKITPKDLREENNKFIG